MGCRCCFVLNQLEELVDAGDSRCSSQFANTKVFCLLHNCMWQCRHPKVDVYVLALCEQTRWLFINKSPCSNMICVYVFVCVLVLTWTLTDTGTQLENRSPCSFIGALAVTWETLSISWTLEPDCCSDNTSLPVLTIGIFVFGWVCWESFPPPATSESHSFIQLVLKGIFGGGRGDAYTFSYMTSPDFIMIAFGIQ